MKKLKAKSDRCLSFLLLPLAGNALLNALAAVYSSKPKFISITIVQVTCQPSISNKYLLQMSFVPETVVVIADQSCRLMGMTSCKSK